ncbi:enoyl-CoA hydratase-related protein [Anaerosinus sp.]
MENETVLYTLENEIATITLNRPKSLNAMNEELVDSLGHYLTRASQDESRAIILTGNGRAFCAGGDLAHLSTLTVPIKAKEFITKVGNLVKQIQAIQKPVIAMVNGVAAGAGFNLVLACDIIYAAKSARFAQSFAKVGLVPDCGGMYLLPRIIGLPKAKELMFTADLINVEAANQLGLINHISEDNALADETYAFAKKLKESAPIALAMIKQTLNESDDLSLNTLLSKEAALQTICMQTKDHQEGLSAFKEKRSPLFSGK